MRLANKNHWDSLRIITHLHIVSNITVMRGLITLLALQHDTLLLKMSGKTALGRIQQAIWSNGEHQPRLWSDLGEWRWKTKRIHSQLHFFEYHLPSYNVLSNLGFTY